MEEQAHLIRERCVPSPLGVVRFRPATRWDLDALVDFYDALSPEARHRRFFAARRLGRADVQELLTMGGHGLSIVATLDHRIAGHAVATAPLGSSAEFGIAVGDDLQGRGVGGALLDELRDAAARRGIDSLQGDVLATNRPMVRLLATRGYAILDWHPSGERRVLLATGAGMPRWPALAAFPRILVEAASVAPHDDVLRDAGHSIAVCMGARSRSDTCPLLRGDRCPLVDGADTVMVRTGSVDEAGQRLLDAHRLMGTRTPICAVG